jgi:hypothetical protein
VIILSTLFRREIGIKSPGWQVFSTSGIRVIYDELILSREILPP